MTDREKELQQRQDRRILCWGKRQGILRQRRLSATVVRIIYKDGRKEEVDFTEHIAKGWVDKDTLELTEEGQLRIHQLAQLEWMINHPRKSKKGKQP